MTDDFVNSLVEANPGTIMVISLDGRVLHANRAAVALTGRPMESLVGSIFTDFAADPEETARAFGLALETGSISDYPLVARHASGTDIHVVVSASVFRDENGEVAGIIAGAHDITDLLEGRRELAEQRDRMKLVLESSRLGLWDWNMVTDEAVIDERFAEILGYTLEELGASTNDLWDRMTHPEDLEREAEVTALHVQGVIPYYDMELRMLHRSGDWVWLRDRGRIVEWDEDGQPVRMTGTIEDVRQARADADRLALAEEQLRLAIDQSAIGICLALPEGPFLRVNRALCDMLGRTEQDLMQRTWQELTHPDDVAVGLGLVQEIVDGTRDSYRLRKRYLAADGSVIWSDLSVAAVRAGDATVRYLICQMSDVTAQFLAEKTVAENEELLRVVLDNSPDPTLRFDATLRVEYVNQGLIAASGMSADEWLGRTIAELPYPPELMARWAEHVGRVFETGERDSFEYAVDSTYGSRWAQTSMAPELGPDGSVAHVVATIRDLTRRRRAEEELLQLATHDSLTGLANRAVVGDELERALQAGRRTGLTTAVLMIDLDRFKNVNDSLGHAAGDDLLGDAARRLEGAVRGGDLVARTGGDEFVVVMRELEDLAHAVQVASRVVASFRAPFPLLDRDIYTTASVGVAIATEHSTGEDLLREADTAMYVAKSEGRDRVVVFNEDLRGAAMSRLALESELRQAVERGELDVWYQPEVDLRTGGVVAVEALLRWHHPRGEVRTAESFIEAAEETGLVVAIGEWVLDVACRDAARWSAARPGAPTTVRVNVSARQLAEPGLLDAVDRALASSGLDPRLLCLEITETALLRSTPQAQANIRGARDRGISVALDDFGTGYASLTYLREYPVDVLKIDRSFITSVTTVDLDRKLVAGIIALAHQLNVEVTAEGVENAEQAACLRGLGCPSAQGFLYSEAVAPHEVDALLTTTFPVH